MDAWSSAWSGAGLVMAAVRHLMATLATPERFGRWIITPAPGG
jgi:hypothetical protein